MTEFITLRDRIRFALLPKRQYLAYQARRASRRGESELEMLQFLVPRGRNAIDGGAHKGIYSWYLSKFCREIYAFEPNPAMFDYLSHAVPGNVRCFYAALSDATGKAMFHIPTSKGRFHHTRGSLLDVEGETGFASVETEVHTIDQHNFGDVGFIKLDLEGAELDALRGGVELIRRDRPVILAEATGVGGSSPGELTKFLLELGYLPLVYRDGRLMHLGKQTAESISHNCFFLPEESMNIACQKAA